MCPVFAVAGVGALSVDFDDILTSRVNHTTEYLRMDSARRAM